MNSPAETRDKTDPLFNPKSFRYNLESLEDYLETGRKVAEDGRLNEAVDLIREAVTRYPDSPTGQYNLGVALFLQVREGRQHPQIWENLAEDEDLQEQALEALSAAIARDPGFIEAYNNLGRLLALRKRYSDAIDVWEKSIAIMPAQPEIVQEIELARTNLAPSKEVV